MVKQKCTAQQEWPESVMRVSRIRCVEIFSPQLPLREMLSRYSSNSNDRQWNEHCLYNCSYSGRGHMFACDMMKNRCRSQLEENQIFKYLLTKARGQTWFHPRRTRAANISPDCSDSILLSLKTWYYLLSQIPTGQ